MTTSYNNFKVGDYVRFTKERLEHYKKNTWWKGWNLTYELVCGVFKIEYVGEYSSKISFKDKAGNKKTVIFDNSKLELAEKPDKTQQILDKIKYLDQRFKDRKCHS